MTLAIERRYPDVKDPSPVYDGERWHVFGTGVRRVDKACAV